MADVNMNRGTRLTGLVNERRNAEICRNWPLVRELDAEILRLSAGTPASPRLETTAAVPAPERRKPGRPRKVQP